MFASASPASSGLMIYVRKGKPQPTGVLQGHKVSKALKVIRVPRGHRVHKALQANPENLLEKRM